MGKLSSPACFFQPTCVKLERVDLPRIDEAGELAQPTRARLFSLLGELRRPAATEELAQRLKLHPNGVRTHLERMREAGLLERTSVRRPRGRPRDEWSIAPKARPGGESPRGYAELGRWLTRAIPARPTRLRDVEQAGREVGRELAPHEVGSLEDAIRFSFTALGFQPAVSVGPDAKLTCTLGNCPYRDAVRDNQEVVCTLHRGITRGLLEAIEPGARLTRFEPKDPDTAGCLVEVQPPR